VIARPAPIQSATISRTSLGHPKRLGVAVVFAEKPVLPVVRVAVLVMKPRRVEGGTDFGRAALLAVERRT
jgi:hypothetical protein